MSVKTESLTTTELKNQLNNENVKLIDLRPVEAYNGWKMSGEIRGGHIKSAKSLPYKWSKYIDWMDIVKAKGLLPDHTLILYGYDKEITEKLANQFKRAGFKKIWLYHNFVDEWSPNPVLPMENLKRYRQLVSAEWLRQLTETKKAPEYDNTNYVICHAHYQNRGAYEQGHIPGAIDVDTNTLESPETWNRRSSPEIKKALEDLGITHKTTVILYGRFSFPNNDDPFPGSSAGQLAAFRCAFIMMYAGVKDVRILNGGLQSWLDAGYKETTEDTRRKPVKDFGVQIPLCPQYAVDLPEAKQILQSDHANLVSVRSWREFIGEVSGYNYIEKKGRIPGAVFGNCGSDAYHMENYRNLDHTTREYHEIEQLWAEAGITPDKHNAFYCGTGWRGSEAFMNAWLMGWPRAAVFDGGWFEWSSDDNNPIETGIPGN
jgi:3-mercaptopyruvate sulfurtransferase SseA